MADLQKIIKVTQAQYNILKAGGTVGEYTGIDPNYLYLVKDTNTWATEDYVDDALDRLSSVAWSGDYSDLTNKPTIPTVNNATLTITQNSTSIGTFTANASSNVSVNIETPQVKRYI